MVSNLRFGTVWWLLTIVACVLAATVHGAWFLVPVAQGLATFIASTRKLKALGFTQWSDIFPFVKPD